jgi:organic radical activating enzyme
MSKTFCPLPWNHLATHPHGICTLCCESNQDDGISQAFNDTKNDAFRKALTLQTVEDFSEITNSDSFSKVRLQMLNGEKPIECNKCWDAESVGNKSKRYYESRRLPLTLEEAIENTNDDGTLKEVNYEFVELRLGNHCNVQCRTCNPYSSSRWLKDWDTVNPERRSLPEFTRVSSFNWPLDEDFWTKLLDRSGNLKCLYINGGEPFLIDKHFAFLETLVERGIAKDVEIVYSTNCTIINHSYEDIWKNFRKVQFMLSIDDLEERNEYIRTYTAWGKVVSFVEWMDEICGKYDNLDYNILQTVSVYNILYIPEFYEYFKGFHISHNFVNDPAHFDPLILPRDVQEIIVDRIGDLTDDVANYLNVKRKQGDISVANLSPLQTFFEKTRTMDTMKKTSFEDTFPELYELIKNYE